MLRGLENENGPVRLFHPVKVRVDARNSGANVLGLFKREHTVSSVDCCERFASVGCYCFH